MAIKFDFYHSPSPEEKGEEQKERFHARVVRKQTIETEALIEEIHERCTLSKGDIKAVLSELHDALKTHLLAGNNVNIKGLGVYSLSLEAPKDANPDKTHAQNIKVKRIEFRADRQLRNEIIAEARFERTCEKVHSANIDSNEIDNLLVDYFKEHSYITRKKFEELFHLTKNTASRHLKRLVEEGRLVNTNTPRNPNYEPVKGCYNRKNSSVKKHKTK